MGGMLAATFLAIFFVPLFFRLITDRKLVEKRSKAELFEEVKHHRVAARHTPATPGHPPRGTTGAQHD